MWCSGYASLSYRGHDNGALSTPAQRRISRTLANLLLLVLVVYLAVSLARMTWLFAWDDRPVPSAPATDGAGNMAGSSGLTTSMAVYDFSGVRSGRLKWRKPFAARRRKPAFGFGWKAYW